MPIWLSYSLQTYNFPPILKSYMEAENSSYRKVNKDLREMIRSFISRDRIDWKVKLTVILNDDVIRVQPNEVNINEMDYGRQYEWDSLQTDRNKINMINEV